MHPIEVPARSSAAFPIVAVFTATIFVSAALLFFVQPLFAKMVLPQIGGAPAVWTTAMLFFQSALIGGYFYAHLSSTYLRPRMQVFLHIALWSLALFFLPLALPEGWQLDPSGPVAPQTLMLFAVGVGVPFGVLASNAPLIQSWYARTDGPSADDPYFLYGASNLGSLIALLGFPLVAEPLFGTRAISWGWTLGFVALGVCLVLVGSQVSRVTGPVTMKVARSAVTASDIARWLLLSFVPASLMLALTTQVSMNLGAVPLIWAVPLALYLLTFVFAFSRTAWVATPLLRIFALAGAAGLAAVFFGFGPKHMAWGWVAFSAAGFFAVALYVHGLLYVARPDRSRLTLFYVIMALGGALGGLFNSILAPLVFDQLWEGALTILIAGLLLIPGWRDLRPRVAARSLILGGSLGLSVTLLVIFAGVLSWSHLDLVPLAAALLAALLLRAAPTAAALAGAAALVAGMSVVPHTSVLRDRSFFGVHTVDAFDTLRTYTNGVTVHGAQRIGAAQDGRPEPLFYYHRNGPMAQVLTSGLGQAARRIGIVGQGIGSLACYAQPGQDWAFYEIDPMVDRIARDPALFTFLSECTPSAPTFLGDARVRLDQQKDRRFDILVIDAYSSDAVPVHLTTLEAVHLYLERLTARGILIFHISNNYYDIHVPLARIADALGLTAWRQHYRGNRAADAADTPSVVMALTREAGHFGDLAKDTRWTKLHSDGGPIWTDDHANLLSILRRRDR